MTTLHDAPEADGDSTIDEPHGGVRVRLVRPGEGAAAVAVAVRANAPGASDGHLLRDALDTGGGHVPFPEVPGAAGWYFAATPDSALIACCTRARRWRSSRPSTHSTVHAWRPPLVEVEILAVKGHNRGRGVATALLQHAEAHFTNLGVRLIVAKVDAADMPVLRWYRHRGTPSPTAGKAATSTPPQASPASTPAPSTDPGDSP